MRPGKRSDRIAEQIRRELSLLILNRLKDPRIGFVTITRVQVTDDLAYAKVYFSVLGSLQARKSTLIALERSKGFLQRSLADVLMIKSSPKLIFKFDPSVEHSVQLDAVIDKIHHEKQAS